MKKSIISITAASLLIWGPLAGAQQQETWQDKLNRQFKNENVSRAVGSVAGALLGSRIGDGSGKVVAIAAGTLAGYWLGGKFSEHLNEADRVGIAGTTEHAIQSGTNATWRNPDTGTSTRVTVTEADARGTVAGGGELEPLRRLPPIELVNSYFKPSVNLNVRGGPGTEYRILYTLKQGSQVPVVGRVMDRDWFLVSEHGMASGFVYAPLMEFSEESGVGGAIRDSLLSERPVERIEVATSACRQVTQQVTLRDGVSDSHSFRVCQQDDGSWVEA